MTRWVRFEYAGEIGFGIWGDDDLIIGHKGDMFLAPRETDESIPLGAVKLLTPTEPSKMVALWNNFWALAEKLGTEHPSHPLYFLKAPNSFLGHGEKICRPISYTGKIVYEGELGIVIGKTARNIGEAEADEHIFGYTCINDVTAIDLLKTDPSFDQWTRAKGFDGFGVFGPCVATGLNPDDLVIKTVLNGTERQNYRASDMIIAPHKIVSLISQNFTLELGDVICCGTSLGVGSMKEPTNIVEVTIDGIGTLTNTFEN